jgi:large subunit ribosomal protein L29
MDAKEIRSMSPADIHEKIEAGKREIFNLRFQRASGQLDNYARIKEVRREVARLKTILREKELAMQIVAKEGR